MTDKDQESKPSKRDMMTDEQRERIREKEVAWNNKVKEASDYKDAVGNKMDDGVIETVAALNLLGFPTNQSCAGHPEKLISPYIGITEPGYPEETYVGQKAVENEIAIKYGIGIGDLKGGKNYHTAAAKEARSIYSKNEKTQEFMEWQNRLMVLWDKADRLIAEFNENREVEPKIKLRHKWGQISMTGNPEDDDPFDETPLTQEQRQELLPRIIAAQKEMRDFTEFLKKKFFETQ
ncbi:MAG TPA: hypothetical protein VD998_00305 [Verrucomicrobiae bacterium]|nr:hypothetical protein [Verrucomicrobiae bacterium]